MAESGNTEGLKFEVKPKIQGIVGNVYNEKIILYDDEMTEDKLKELYNLSNFQKSKVNGTKFVLGVPLFNEKDNVDVIITMDSEDDIKINDTNIDKWNLMATKFCQSMHHCVPILYN